MYSIEDLIEQIPEYKTKDLFNEIYSLFTQNQYRATVVMLWTVVICDLIYKLQYLENLYSDETAIKILNEIRDFQAKNPKNPDWEKILVEKIEARTELLSKIDRENLEYIQKQRNLCAHPIITEDKLFQPSKDLTRSLIRLALESILIKSPLLVKNYINTIVDDFAKRQSDFFLDDEKAIKYFESKYLKHLNKTQTLKLFRALWKFVFKAHTLQEEQNIYINEVLLSYLIQLRHKIKEKRKLYMKRFLFAAAVILMLGFLLKYLDERIDHIANGKTCQNFIMMRYAEVLLNYAEAINEAEDSETARQKAVEQLNRIRTRAGVGLLDAADYDQSTLRERIRKERRVELCFEEHRFFDIKRWKIASEVMRRPAIGIAIENGQYTRVALDSRSYNDRMNLMPIPMAEVYNCPLITQNPGY